MEAADILPLLAGTLRVSTPLILAALAGLFSERAGIVDVGLEGKMLAGAFAAAATAAVTGSVWAGLGAALAASLALGLLHGVACITLRGNQVVSGMAINILASGLTAMLALAWFRQGGQTPTLPASGRFLALPLPEAVGAIPLLGPVLARVVGGQTLPVWFAFLAVPVAGFVLARTRFGLRLRAAGENPAALDTAGVSVARLRYAGVVIAALLCGVAGAAIATAQGAGFVRDMVAGRGFIALAAMILGMWRPWPVLLACLGFGLLDMLAIRLQGVAVPGIGAFPVQAVQALPYLLTVILLAGFVGRAIPPKASGLPYVKER
ncbi:ABC transporter permease [Roseomonas sp. OT10]|uniref:ABC transporter permease n=1 Tax=Roseomonas cutis TaxID=2897332 RepID=UPI001E619508|nr:ABC transporter permease [Roseomonas sp. OT10]UFN47521.1 ABC transporter permease [Roseomonas sp. OT10]